MMRLLILGAGQYGRVAMEIAEAMGIYSHIAFLDDYSESAVGTLKDISQIPHDEAIVAIGDPTVREQLLGMIDRPATLIHPRAVVMPSATVGVGTIMEAGAVISSGVHVGDGCIIMANAVVGHDATVGAYCQLKYHCTVSERCVVPPKTKVDCHVVIEDLPNSDRI